MGDVRRQYRYAANGMNAGGKMRFFSNFAARLHHKGESDVRQDFSAQKKTKIQIAAVIFVIRGISFHAIHYSPIKSKRCSRWLGQYQKHRPQAKQRDASTSYSLRR